MDGIKSNLLWSIVAVVPDPLYVFWKPTTNSSHLSRLLMKCYEFLAFPSMLFHGAGTTWVAENLFGHATTIWDPWFLPFVGHGHLLELPSRGPLPFSRRWFGQILFSKMLMPFEKVSSGSWLILVYPKGLDGKPQDCDLWRKFPVEKFEIQQKFTGTSRWDFYIHNTRPFKMFNALNPFLQVFFLLSPFGYIHLCLRIISRKCFALDFQCLGWVGQLDVSDVKILQVSVMFQVWC